MILVLRLASRSQKVLLSILKGEEVNKISSPLGNTRAYTNFVLNRTIFRDKKRLIDLQRFEDAEKVS